MAVLGADRRAMYEGIVKKNCETVEVNYRLMMAIIEVESAWNPYAVRFEPNFTFESKPVFWSNINNVSVDTERELQRFSWGLGQVMGATARDMGMRGPLPSLCEADCGSFWAAMYLKRICTKFVPLKDQISAYNAGTPKKDDRGLYANQDYVDRVYRVLNTIV